VATYDVLYYIKSISAVWAYSVKHTGTLDAVLPGRSAPASVTVSGVTYTLGSSSSSVAVSSIGSFKTGDAITLLMGRDGVVAAIVGAANVDATVYGVVTGSEPPHIPPLRKLLSSKYVDLLGSDGLSYRFTVSRDYVKGTIVKASSNGGSVTVNSVASGTLSGKVNASGTTMGSYNLRPTHRYWMSAVSPASRFLQPACKRLLHLRRCALLCAKFRRSDTSVVSG
jgi:hypothetical protein